MLVSAIEILRRFEVFAKAVRSEVDLSSASDVLLGEDARLGFIESETTIRTEQTSTSALRWSWRSPLRPSRRRAWQLVQQE